MLHVHHVVADVERPQILDEGPRVVAPRLALARTVGAATEDLLLGDDHEAFAGQHHAAAERADHDLGVDLVLAGARARGALVEPRGVERRGAHAAAQVLVPQEAGEALGLGLGARGEKHAQPVLIPVADAARHRRERHAPALGGPRDLHRAGEVFVIGSCNVHAFARHLVAREALVLAGDGRAVQHRHVAAREVGDDLRFLEEERGREELRLRRLRRGIGGGAPQLVEDDARDRRRVREHEARVLRKVVGERRELVVVRRQERVGPEERAAARDVVEEARLHGRKVDQVGQLQHAHAGAIDVLLREDGVARGRQPELGERDVGARGLRDRVERLDRYHAVAVELDARRVLGAGRPHVEQGAAHRERSRILDHRHAQVAAFDEITHEPLAIEIGIGHDAMGVRLHDGPRHELAGERSSRDHEHPEGSIRGEVTERGHAAERGTPVGVHVGVGRGLGGREHEDLVALAHVLVGALGAPEQELHVLRDGACRVDVLGDNDDGTAAGTRERADDERIRAAPHACDVETRRRRGTCGDLGQARDDHTLVGEDGR